VIGLLLRMLRSLLGQAPEPQPVELPPTERLEAAKQQLKETTPPPED
jgi:hypothetical protein